MDFRHVFFDPKGRLAPRPFAQAYILLTGAMLVITVVSSVALTGFGILQYALVFPYVCVFGKRLHDAGLSAWLWLAFLIGYMIFSSVLTAILLPILSPEAMQIQLEVQKVMEADGFNAAMDELTHRAPEIARTSALASVASFLITSGFVGFVAYSLKSDPSPNRHGPPPPGAGRRDPRP